jgi:hypothetical protein
VLCPFLSGLSRKRDQGDHECGELHKFEIGELFDAGELGDRAERDLTE